MVDEGYINLDEGGQATLPGMTYDVTGQGYESTGEIRHVAGAGETDLDPILLPMVLCADAVVEEQVRQGKRKQTKSHDLDPLIVA